MSTDVLAYLYSKGLNPRRASGDEVHVACPFCGENPAKRGRLYVNINPDAEIPGLHHCKLCDHRGSIITLQRYYGDATEKQEREDTGYLRRLILEEAAAYYHSQLTDHALAWLKHERGLTIETVVQHQLGYADGGLLKMLRKSGYKPEDIQATGLARYNTAGRMEDFLNGHITIPYHVSGNVVMIRGRSLAADDPKKYVTPTGQKSRLFNTDTVWDANEIVITEGEFDAMVVEQLGFKAVAVPGAGTWQDSWDAYFDHVRRVYVVFDNDDAGVKGAGKVVDHLGSRTRVVTMPETEPGAPKNDPSSWIVAGGHTAADFDDLLRAARGGMLVTVEDAIDEWLSLQGKQGLKFGIRQFDQHIRPGLLGSQVMILLANTNVGKTLMLLNLFQRVCDNQPDAKILFFSLEQTRGDWWERARRIYRFFNMGASDEDALRFWRDRIRLVDLNRVSEDQVLAAIDDFSYELGKPSLVAIDYLGYFARSFRGGDQYTRTTDAVMAIKGIAKDRLVPTVVPSQVSRSTTPGMDPALNSARDSGAVEETGDFVCSLWTPDSGRDRRERTGEFNISIHKSRHGGKGHVEHMWFAPLNLAIVADEQREHAVWARNEVHYDNAYSGETWEHALVRHESGLSKMVSNFVEVEETLWRKRQGTLRAVS